jgi:hypothetical protein
MKKTIVANQRQRREYRQNLLQTAMPKIDTDQYDSTPIDYRWKYHIILEISDIMPRKKVSEPGIGQGNSIPGTEIYVKNKKHPEEQDDINAKTQLYINFRLI